MSKPASAVRWDDPTRQPMGKAMAHAGSRTQCRRPSNGGSELLIFVRRAAGPPPGVPDRVGSASTGLVRARAPPRVLGSSASRGMRAGAENGERGYQLTFAIAHIRDIFRLGVSGAYRAD